MRTIKLFLLISFCFYLSSCFITRERYEEIKASVNFEVMEYESFLEKFGDKTYDDMFKYKGKNHLISDEDLLHLNRKDHKVFLDMQNETSNLKATLPENFDWRNIYPTCFYSPRDQGHCGSCYSFSASFSLESRMCIKGRGIYQYRLSQQDIISCDVNNQKCFGDTIVNTYSFLENVGTCPYECKPYMSYDMSMPGCSYSCVNSAQPYVKYRAQRNSFWASNDIQAIKENLYHFGPLSTFMATYEDMHMFKSNGVYQHLSGKQTDYHAIVVIGWGKDQPPNREYWILRNSWGDDWGDKGYFKVWFNDLEINDYVCGSLPLV